jgi:hypothetical protein
VHQFINRRGENKQSSTLTNADPDDHTNTMTQTPARTSSPENYRMSIISLIGGEKTNNQAHSQSQTQTATHSHKHHDPNSSQQDMTSTGQARQRQTRELPDDQRSSLAPVTLQYQSSSLAMTKAADRLGEAPSNMHSFLCRQSVQGQHRRGGRMVPIFHATSQRRKAQQDEELALPNSLEKTVPEMSGENTLHQQVAY